MTKINIGIQARLNSQRMPEKILHKIHQKPIIEYVIDAVRKTQRYINRNTSKHNMHVEVSLLVPDNECDLKELIKTTYTGVTLITGDEHDVLSRYIKLLDSDSDIDYVTRITADCPLIPPPYIHKCIQTAVMGELDYVSNAITQYRTTWDGSDVEVISARLLKWLDAGVSDKYMREHVTLYLQKQRPSWANVGMVFSGVDMSDIKLSVDTIEDYERIKKSMNEVKRKMHLWELENGADNTYRH